MSNGKKSLKTGHLIGEEIVLRKRENSTRMLDSPWQLRQNMIPVEILNLEYRAPS